MVDSLTNSNTPVNWEYLRKKGLEHLQEVTGHIWTDYNIHDPGVTLLEALCYGIEDLDSRISENIESVLSDESGKLKGRFFSPGEILTINPVTINDYRKLLIDIPGVKNAWLERETDIDPDIYYDKDNNALLYDYSAKAQKILLNGLYRVHIEKENNLEKEYAKNEQVLREEVKSKLHAHRNLCEDFEDIRIVEEEVVSLYSDIQIDEDSDANEVIAWVYFELMQFVSPRIQHYSLKQMLNKGKSIEQIFNGPSLENGFIDDDELGIGYKRRELHTSDLIRIIMSHPSVKDVRNLFVSNIPNPGPADKQEWALVLDDTKALVLEPFNGQHLRLFKNNAKTPVDAVIVSEKIKALVQKSKNKINESTSSTPPVLSEKTELFSTYDAISPHLPSNYGISETGLPSAASTKRRAQAKQLRGYLLFFEQILINYLKQLESFKDVFALNQNRDDIIKTYFSRLLPESIWADNFAEVIEGYQYVEDNTNSNKLANESAFNRKNRILNHLLSLFNEKFADYALFGYQFNKFTSLDPLLKKSRFLDAKAGLLENYPKLSYNKYRTFNILDNTNKETNVAGLKNLIASKLGFDAHTRELDQTDEWDNFHVVEHILFRPKGEQTLDFVCAETILEDFQPDPYSYRVSYVIPKGIERFKDSSFRQLVYETIEEETPAHINYNVLEFDGDQLQSFKEVYSGFLNELETINQNESDQYNSSRNTLINLLEIGRVKLPVLHLSAKNVSALNDPADPPEDGEIISVWKDLSFNHNDILPTAGSAVTSIKEDQKLPVVRFTDNNQLLLNKQAFETEFTIGIVYKATIAANDQESLFQLLASNNNASVGLGVSIKNNGNVVVSLESEEVELESTLGLSHMLIFSGNFENGELRVVLDGTVHDFKVPQFWVKTAAPEQLYFGSTKAGITLDVGEIVLLDSSLFGPRKRKLEEYLSEEWSIALSAVSSIQKPILHLDADAISSVKRDISSGKTESWQDLSESRIDAIQGVEFNRPIYNQNALANRPSLQFKGSSSLIIDSTGNPLIGDRFSIGIVYKSDKSEGQILSGTGNAGKGFEINIGKNGAVTLKAESDESVIYSSLGSPHILIISGQLIQNTYKISLYLDGQSIVDGTFFNPLMFNIGSELLTLGQNLTGEIGEVIIFDEELSLLNRQRLEDFLSIKWKVDTTGVNPITKPIVHLDPSRLTTVLLEDNKVARLNDIGPYGNHAIQNSEKRRPEFAPAILNQLGSVVFTQIETIEDYHDDSLIIDRTIQDDFTIFVVFRPDSTHFLGSNSELDGKDVTPLTHWTEGVAVVDADCSGYFNDFGISFGKIGDKMVVMAGIGHRQAKDHTLQSGELEFNQTALVSLSRIKENGEVNLYVNGLLHKTADLTDGAKLNDARFIKVGAFNSEGIPFRGQIGEIIVLDHVLKDHDRQRIEKYLANKWSITIRRIPVNTADLWLHLDANEKETIYYDTDRKVSDWEDTNFLDYATAQQVDQDFKPVYVPEGMNSLPALRFNNTYLEIASQLGQKPEFTLAIVFNALSWGNSHPNSSTSQYGAGIIDNYLSNHPDKGFGIYTKQSVETGSAGLTVRVGNQSSETDFSLQTPHIAIVKGNSNSGVVHTYIDGLKLSDSIDLSRNVNLEMADLLSIGATHDENQAEREGYFHGDIAEIIITNNEIDTRERQLLEKYLSDKWKIDISGVNNIIRPILHLDASKLDTILFKESTGKVEKWLDTNLHDYAATQPTGNLRPVFVEAGQNDLPVIRFDQSSLIVPGLVQDDFTIILVYKTDIGIDVNEYMPIAPDAFEDLTMVSSSLSQDIWNHLKEDQGLIDDDGKVLPTFTPKEPGFSLNLTHFDFSATKQSIENSVFDTLTEFKNLKIVVPGDEFMSIDGINKTLSLDIWNKLKELNHLDDYGSVLSVITKGDATFDIYLNHLVESALIQIIMADNWFEGVGLFDGNSPGDKFDLNKRDFGLLIGKDSNLIAGIGVIGGDENAISVASSLNHFHIALFTRSKKTGLVSLRVDDSDSVSENMGRGVTLEDSEQFTIGSVNTGGNYFKGDIAEIILLDKALSHEESEKIRLYLAKKWDIGQ
ncbi:MAG: LamG domain-containing protein [Proteobacteria bacterium]|nr:LamG domain-containing protein [Pseudomonadota bacterium]